MRFCKTKKANENIDFFKCNEILVEDLDISKRIEFQLDGDCFFKAPVKIETTNFFINMLKGK